MRRIPVKGDLGTEFTWDAEADFESGFGGFVVLRDGRGVATLPEKPPDREFGRPLFQGLSFHDTPEGPMPEMRYRDASAKPGTKHTYAVITLNSAEVASQLSAPVSGQ